MRLSPRRRPTKALLVALVTGFVLSVAPLGSSAAAATETLYVANCAANLRASTSTSSTLIASIPQGTTVLVTETVTGDPWTASCNGATLTGSTWYTIIQVGGLSTRNRYNLSAVFAATGLFKLAPTPPPPGTMLEGIDVSQWQGTIDWAGVAYAGKSFAIMKASEGQTFADPSYATNHAGARAHGVRVGAYHFASPDTLANDAVIEADSFVQKMAIQPGDLNPALDIEQSGGLTVAALQTWLSAWLNEVYAKVGMRPMIYTSPAFWSKYLGNTTMFADQGYTVLWVAHWFVSAPTVPASNWGGHGWTFWQYDDCGHVLGISGCVDLDRYNGLDLTKVTYDPQLTISAPSVSVKQGATVAMPITITRQYFTLPVTLSVTGLPAGTTAAFDAVTTTASSTTLRITTSSTGTITPVGTSSLTITGVTDTATKTATPNLSVIDGFVPTVTAPVTFLPSGVLLGSSTSPIYTRWTGTDESSGISGFGLQAQVNGGSWGWVSTSSPTALNVLRSLSFSSVYRYRVRATDKAGNVSGWAYGRSFKSLLTQESNSAVLYSSGWSSMSTTAASGGTLKYTTAAGAWTSYTFSGAGISWVADKGPGRGSAQIYIDGALAATISLNASTYQSKRILFSTNWDWNATHTIKVVNLATAGHPRIDSDAFIRLVLI